MLLGLGAAIQDNGFTAFCQAQDAQYGWWSWALGDPRCIGYQSVNAALQTAGLKSDPTITPPPAPVFQPPPAPQPVGSDPIGAMNNWTPDQLAQAVAQKQITSDQYSRYIQQISDPNAAGSGDGIPPPASCPFLKSMGSDGTCSENWTLIATLAAVTFGIFFVARRAA